jgi:enoyl-CoA hydratase
VPDFQTLLYEADTDGIATITLNRAESLNALSQRTIAELAQAFRAARQDAAVRGVVLTGAGEKAFAAGADISEFDGMEPLQAHRFSLRGQAVFSQIENMAKPVVAAVNGFALGGGCELAMACHLRSSGAALPPRSS